MAAEVVLVVVVPVVVLVEAVRVAREIAVARHNQDRATGVAEEAAAREVVV